MGGRCGPGASCEDSARVLRRGDQGWKPDRVHVNAARKWVNQHETEYVVRAGLCHSLGLMPSVFALLL